MTHAEKSSVPSFSCTYPTQALFGLALLLAGLLIVAAGCSSTHHVSQSEPNEYARVTEAAAGETARVHLRDGRTLKLEDLYVGPDSTSGIVLNTRYGRRTFSTSEIRSVDFVNRGIGFVQGAGLGFGVPFGLGVIVSVMMKQEQIIPPWFYGAALGIPGGLVGAIVGAISGDRETYHFSAPSQETASTSATARSSVQNESSRK